MKVQVNQTRFSVAAATMLFVLSGPLQANSAPVLEVQDHVVELGSKLNLLLAPTDVDGVTPNVFVKSGPSEGVLSDNGDGTRTFAWQPKRKGDYTVSVIVQDGADANMANQYAYNIKVIGNQVLGGGVAANVAIKAVGTRINSAGRQPISAAVEAIGTAVSVPAISADSGSNVVTSNVVTGEVVTGEVVTSNVNIEPSVSNKVEPVVVAASDNNIVAEPSVATVEPADSSPKEPAPVVSPAAPEPTIFLGSEVGAVTKILTDLPVSTSQTNVQQSPIDVSGRYLYTANIEPGPNGDSKGVRLRTILRQGQQRGDNSWEWKNVTVDDRTLYDRWHSAPSVAVDKSGEIHVAYNMHNFPWQYKKSERAHDISSMVFKGQQITDAELKLAEEKNRTRFPTLGSAAIPGNQITYPAFYKDRNNDLYVSYRFAAAPKRAFFERIMSTGIAKYNANNRSWSAIGARLTPNDGDFDKDSGSPDAAMPFAGKQGWTSYIPKVVFSKQNNMIVSMFWRSGIADRQIAMPCVVRSISNNDVVDMKGGSISLPVQPEQCGNVGIPNSREFYSIGSFAIDNEDNPYLLMSPTEGSRFISRYSASQQRWIEEKAPEAATEIFFDNDNNLYAVASGIKIFKRSGVSSAWEKIYDENSPKYCYPKVVVDKSGKNAFIHTQSCDEKHITIYGLRLP